VNRPAHELDYESTRHSRAAMAGHPLVVLGELLRGMNYHFITVTPLTHQCVNERAGNEWARDLTDVFGWSRPFQQGVVGTDIFTLLHRAGALERHGTGWISKVRWSTLGDTLFVHSRFPTNDADSVFFGPDTYRFAQALRMHLHTDPRASLRVADIGCGAGPGAILCALARPASEVLAIDINDRALDFTAINCRLAGADNVQAVHSNLLADVPGDFDLIVSNPPYLLDAKQRAYRHGGGELGAALSLQIVDSALSRLTPGGTLLLYTGVAMVHGTDPFLAQVRHLLQERDVSYNYREVDPDVFGEELQKPGYENVDRIAAVVLSVTRDL
jgi:methylase of polypeptide subunit release factors